MDSPFALAFFFLLYGSESKINFILLSALVEVLKCVSLGNGYIWVLFYVGWVTQVPREMQVFYYF